MKKIIVISSLLVMFMFLVSCAPQITNEELEAELAKLTPEQREELLADLESKGGSAFAGQAIAKKYSSSKMSSVNVQQMKSMLEKMDTRAQCKPSCPANSFCANLEGSCFPKSLSCFDSDGGNVPTVKGRLYSVEMMNWNSNPGYSSVWDIATGLPAVWPGSPKDNKFAVFRGIDTCYINSVYTESVGLEKMGDPVLSCSAGGNCFILEFSCDDPALAVFPFSPCVHGCSNGACLPAPKFDPTK